MIVSSKVPGREWPRPARPGRCHVAGLDVEWSRNHRVAGGIGPFCYVVAWLADPAFRAAGKG